MALFGAPVAHEDHAQRACHAALSIQKAMKDFGEKTRRECGVDFKMRVGLNSGPVVMGSIGDDLRMDYTAVGDTTNIAARMESLTKPGTILVSQDTYNLAKDFFVFQPLGKVQVKGVEYLGRANQKAIKLNAIEEAMAYFDEAMKLLDSMPDTDENRKRRMSLLLNQWIVFQLLFKFPDYHDFLTRYESMAIELDEPGLLGAFYARLGHCQWASGYPEKCIRTATKAAELCEAAGNAVDAGYAYGISQWSHLLKGNYDKSIGFKDDTLRKMEQQFNLRWYVWAFSAALWAYGHLGRWDQAVEEAKEAMRVAEEYADSSLISFVALTTSWVYTWKWDLDRAIKYGDLAVQRAPTPADKVWAQSILAWTWCRAGEPQKGVEILAATLPIMRGGVFRPTEIPFMVFLGEGYWVAGEHHKARQTLEEALELAERCEYSFYSGWAQRLLSEIAIEANLAQAAPHFEKSITVLREIKAENEQALAYAGYARFHKKQGNIEEAREYLAKALEIFERLGTLIEPDKVRKELAQLPET